EMALAQEMKKELEANGKSAYILARGGSCPLGNCGYILCADEILSQAKEINVAFDYVVCPSGTGGTQTGLLVGFEMANASISLLGINVSQNNEKRLPAMYHSLDQISSFLDMKAPDREKVKCFDAFFGEGYSKPTIELKEAIELLARTEGIMLDPIYSGKAMAGLIGLIRNGEIEKGSKIVFLHTGGFTPYYDYTTMM
ncbi:MAG: pyridoxal-phosphate dependent enzyme, partial [Vallitaleaceae bacterium]|nr:pyridoxal-phosphate dependent enzyme [Vallitaleaceae bacterium]